MELNRKHMKY